ncbi:hypothetical protein [Streptomyces sp. 891-h]|uniref:hypothetical protein n=1 Tax=unclassified Streptomyces TaxID=2593676 RepID=UPI001FA9DEDB|nr:hypothetical protein [Streptomyces sp. 891-h]
MTELPHTRSRALHWLATAAALAAVLGGTALLQPATATPATAPGRAPDPERARYPLDCGPAEAGVDVLDKAAADFDGDGAQETVAVVRCQARGGTPPSAVFVLTGAPGQPRIGATLVEQREGMSVDDLAVRGTTISATLLGYSSADVPRCCPDKRRTVKWEWSQGKFALRPGPVAGGGVSV